MKNNKKVCSLIIIVFCIIIGIVAFFVFNNNSKTRAIGWDIKIHEHYNNIFAGRRAHEVRVLLIDSKNGVGKITYMDEKNEFKETSEFKIRKQDITKILKLAEQGTETKEIKNKEIYTVYEIESNTKTTFVDSIVDEENIISNLFID